MARLKIRRVDFYPSEWLAGTIGMPADEIAAYVQICMLIYDRGGPIPDDEQWLARVCGMHWRTFRRVRLNLLARQKVSAESGHVSITRCILEIKKVRHRISEASQNGAKGGRPNGLAKAPGFPTGNRNESYIQLPTTTTNESREKENEKKKRAGAGRASSNGSAFDLWWGRYPEKVGKAAARQKFETALKRATLDQLVDGLDRYKATKPPDRPWCNPATWLHQDRWLDEPATTTNGVDHGTGSATGVPFTSTPTRPPSSYTLEELVEYSRRHPH